MEERKLNEKESLELIAQMIQNNKKQARNQLWHAISLLGIYHPLCQPAGLVSGSNYRKLLLAIPMVLTPYHRRNRNLPLYTLISSRVSRLIWTK